jgi:adenine deaminase
MQHLKKAELHVHLEGSLEPEMLLALALKNKIKIKYNSIAEIKQAYQFNNLQEFLDLYYQGMSVLHTEQDFFDLTYAYLTKAHHDNVTHTEMFIDPQGHISRGILLKDVFNGITNAIKEANKNYSITANLIVCFLRHLSEIDALKTFDQVMEFRHNFIGIGLDSSELGHPPHKFKNLFAKARNEKLKLVAHAGEEGPARYVWEALDILGVDRIDHGNAILTDKELIQRIVKDNIPLTMCPLSNKSLQVVPDLKEHQALKLLNHGVCVTINSDDPAYFGGYINQNYTELAAALALSPTEIAKFAELSLSAKFV